MIALNKEFMSGQSFKQPQRIHTFHECQVSKDINRVVFIDSIPP